MKFLLSSSLHNLYFQSGKQLPHDIDHFLNLAGKTEVFQLWWISFGTGASSIRAPFTVTDDKTETSPLLILASLSAMHATEKLGAFTTANLASILKGCPKNIFRKVAMNIMLTETLIVVEIIEHFDRYINTNKNIKKEKRLSTFLGVKTSPTFYDVYMYM